MSSGQGFRFVKSWKTQWNCERRKNFRDSRIYQQSVHSNMT